MTEFFSNCPEDTEKIALDFSETLIGGEVIAFRGGMGMGKTLFTRALAKGLGFKGAVASPTFAIVNEYRGGRLPVFHFDMFRIESWEDLDSCGFFDYMEEKGVMAVEWSENIDSALDCDTIFITIEKISDNERKITVEGDGF